jgi:hypothetical protein
MTAEPKRYKVDVHVGASILRAANEYEKVHKVILEAIQNAIDANASNIYVSINHKKRFISIRDDGDGVDDETFGQAINNIGKSIKGVGSLGKWGIGLIAPLGKCESFTFTSQKKNSYGGTPNPYYRWTFVTADIEKSVDALELYADKVDLNFSRSPKGKTKNGVSWRTSVEIHNFTKDRKISKLNIHDLAEEAASSFRDKMLASSAEQQPVIYFREERADGSVYHEKAEAHLFQGEPLDEFELRDENGFAKFEIYLSNRRGTEFVGNGVGIHEGSDPFAVPVSNFIKAVGDELPDEVATALKSGVFEGKIMCNHIELEAKRTHFKENDGLTAFILKLIEWYEAVGQDYYESNSESLESERFRKNAEQVLEQIHKIFQEPAMNSFVDILKQFAGKGVGITAPNPEGDSTEPIGGDIKPPAPANPGPGPGTDGGKPGGKTRRGKGKKNVVTGKVGINFSDTNEGHKPWYFEKDTATIFINVEHPFYNMCFDSRYSDKAIRDYQTQIFFHVLAVLEHDDPDESAMAEIVLERVLRMEVVRISGS